MGVFTKKETKENFLTQLWLNIKQYKMEILSTDEFLDRFYNMFDDESIIEFKKRVV